MVRKKRALEDQRVNPLPGEKVQTLVEHWLERIRGRLPTESTLAVTIQKLPLGTHLISFRAELGKEAYVSEAREANIERGVQEAAIHLLERIEQSPPEARSGFSYRVSRLFREAS